MKSNILAKFSISVTLFPCLVGDSSFFMYNYQCKLLLLRVASSSKALQQLLIYVLPYNHAEATFLLCVWQRKLLLFPNHELIKWLRQKCKTVNATLCWSQN